MTLLELTEPLFQNICRINRAGRKGAAMDYTQLRTEIDGLFDRMQAQSGGDYKLSGQYKDIEMPLIYFVDSMISESGLTCARQWNWQRIAFEHKELAGDEKFFDLLEDTMKETGEAASERLAVYYTCLGLGFTGWYYSQPEYLRKKMLEISQRIRGVLEADATARICPEAYMNVDGRNLIEPPTGRVWLMVLIFVVCMATAIASNFYLFTRATDDLDKSLKTIHLQRANLGA